MNTDAAILTLLADLQRDKAVLAQRCAELEQQVADLSAREETARG